MTREERKNEVNKIQKSPHLKDFFHELVWIFWEGGGFGLIWFGWGVLFGWFLIETLAERSYSSITFCVNTSFHLGFGHSVV